MKSKCLIAASLLVLAACGREPAAAVASIDASGAKDPVPAAAGPEVSFVYDPMPKGVVVAVPYHLRGDRIYADARGNYRRRVTFEYLEGDADAVFDVVVASLVDAGFVAKEKRKQDGRLSIGFLKKGVGAVLLSVNPKAVNKPAHPDAKGMFVLDYPYSGKTIAAPPAASP